MDQKLYGAMVRLDEQTYFDLRKIALEQHSTFNRLARGVLEKYLANEKRAGAQEKKVNRGEAA